MGFISNLLFGKYKSPIGTKEKKLMTDEKARAQREQDEADALKLKQDEDRKSLKQRGTTMRGGGRKGLMFSGDQQGVA